MKSRHLIGNKYTQISYTSLDSGALPTWDCPSGCEELKPRITLIDNPRPLQLRWEGAWGTSTIVRTFPSFNLSDPTILKLHWGQFRTENDNKMAPRDLPRCRRTTPSVNPGGHGKTWLHPGVRVRRSHGAAVTTYNGLRHRNRKVLLNMPVCVSRLASCARINSRENCAYSVAGAGYGTTWRAGEDE